MLIKEKQLKSCEFYSETLLRTIGQRDSLSDSSEEPFWRGKRGARIYRRFCWKIKHVVKHQNITANCNKTRQNKFRHFKLMILVLSYVWEDVRIWAHRNCSSDRNLNYLGPISCYPFPSWIPSRCTVERWLHRACWQQHSLFIEVTGDILCPQVWQVIQTTLGEHKNRDSRLNSASAIV